MLVAVVAVAVLAALAGCEPPVATPAEPVDAGDQSYSLCPPSDAPIEPAVTDRAIDVLESRLAYLGIEGASVTAGTCIDVTLPVASDDPTLAAAFGSGHVSVLAVRPERVGEAVVGEPPPPDSMVLAADADIVAFGTETGSSGEPSLTLQLAPAAAEALGAWTSANVGGSLAIVVDGVVLAVPRVAEPIQGGGLTIAFAAPPVVPLQAVQAMLASGPLPEEWAQAQDPEG